MPWDIKKNHSSCPGSKPYAVVKRADGEVEGCHSSREKAKKQLAALNIAENKAMDKESELEEKEIESKNTSGKEIDEDHEKMMDYEHHLNYVPFGITSFDDLDAYREAQEFAQETHDMAQQFADMVSNIMASDLVEDKETALASLADEFKSRATSGGSHHEDADDKEVSEPDESIVDKITGKAVKYVVELFGGEKKTTVKNHGFMVYKDKDGDMRWIGRFSNNFLDDDVPREIIAARSHRSFVDKVEKGKAPLPELWIWHVKDWKVGEADWVALDELDNGVVFPVAGGRIYKECEEVVKQAMSNDDVRLSHGMPNSTIVRDKSNESIIIDHETREISLLPEIASANKITGFMVLKEEHMAIPDEKRKKLIEDWQIDPDALARVEKLNASEAEKAVQEQTEYKEKTQETGEEKVDEANTDQETETTDEGKGDETPEYVTVDEVSEAIKQIVDPIMQQLTDLSTAVKELQADDEEKFQKALKETPAASVQNRIIKSVIGEEQTRVDGRTSLANQAPKETETEKEKGLEGPTTVPFLNKMLSGTNVNNGS